MRHGCYDNLCLEIQVRSSHWKFQADRPSCTRSGLMFERFERLERLEQLEPPLTSSEYAVRVFDRKIV